MYKIITYTNKNGKDAIAQYLKDLGLEAATNKNSRIKRNKIIEYLKLLEAYGTRAGLPYMKHIDEGIWELRPLDDRIFYAYWKEDVFVLLHYFHKKSNKTPVKEIKTAKRNLKDFLERNDK